MIIFVWISLRRSGNRFILSFSCCFVVVVVLIIYFFIVNILCNYVIKSHLKTGFILRWGEVEIFFV